MSEIKVCRICLRTKVKMYHFNLYKLKCYYEEVMAVNVKMNDGLPQHFCYECASALHKFHKFKQKCYIGNKLLKDMLWKGPITYESINEVDLENTLLKSPLTKVTVMDQLNEFYFTNDSQETKHYKTEIDFQTENVVKQENIDLDYFSDSMTDKVNIEPCCNDEENENLELEITSDDNTKCDNESCNECYEKENSDEEFAENKYSNIESIELELETETDDDVDSKSESDNEANDDKSDELYIPPTSLLEKQTKKSFYQMKIRLEKKKKMKNDSRSSSKRRPLLLPPLQTDNNIKKKIKVKRPNYGKSIQPKRTDSNCNACGLDINNRNCLNTHRLCFKKSVEAFIIRQGRNSDQTDATKSNIEDSQNIEEKEKDDEIERDDEIGNNNLNCSNDSSTDKEDTEPLSNLKSKSSTKIANCIVCGLEFGDKNSLETHSMCFKNSIEAFMKEYENDDRHVCQICGLSLKPASLAAHLNMHTGKKFYECPTCGKKFYTSTHLKTHIMTHTGERPYKCPACDKRFSQESNMKIHHHTVHLKLPYHKKYYYKRKKLDAPIFPWEVAKLAENKKLKVCK